MKIVKLIDDRWINEEEKKMIVSNKTYINEASRIAALNEGEGQVVNVTVDRGGVRPWSLSSWFIIIMMIMMMKIMMMMTMMIIMLTVVMKKMIIMVMMMMTMIMIKGGQG